MSFAISGTNYGIATQEEGYACGLLNSYTTTTNNDKKLLSLQYIQSNSKNVNGPSYYKTYSDLQFFWTKANSFPSAELCNLSDIYGSSNIEFSLICSSDYKPGFNFDMDLFIDSGDKRVYLLGARANSLKEILNSISSNLSGGGFMNLCNSISNIKYFLNNGSQLVLESSNLQFPSLDSAPTLTLKILQKDRLVTGKSFQSYNITRPWHWRISEDTVGSVAANTITAQYRYSNSTNVPNSMTVKDFLSRGSAYFGGSVSGGKTVSVNLPVNRFYILGQTGSLASLPKYDKLTFWCGSTKTNCDWYGYYAQRSSGTLVADWKNQVKLSSGGKNVVHGNDSGDAPFYSWNFLQAINNAYGVNFLID
jgi:hypothetical protein